MTRKLNELVAYLHAAPERPDLRHMPVAFEEPVRLFLVVAAQQIECRKCFPEARHIEVVRVSKTVRLCASKRASRLLSGTLVWLAR